MTMYMEFVTSEKTVFCIKLQIFYRLGVLSVEYYLLKPAVGYLPYPIEKVVCATEHRFLLSEYDKNFLIRKRVYRISQNIFHISDECDTKKKIFGNLET